MLRRSGEIGAGPAGVRLRLRCLTRRRRTCRTTGGSSSAPRADALEISSAEDIPDPRKARLKPLLKSQLRRRKGSPSRRPESVSTNALVLQLRRSVFHVWRDLYDTQFLRTVALRRHLVLHGADSRRAQHPRRTPGSRLRRGARGQSSLGAVGSSAPRNDGRSERGSVQGRLHCIELRPGESLRHPLGGSHRVVRDGSCRRHPHGHRHGHPCDHGQPTRRRRVHHALHDLPWRLRVSRGRPRRPPAP